MNDILKLNAVEASAALQKGDTSSVELTKAYLAAADATAALNNYVTLCEDKALEMAQQSDKRRADGQARPLEGCLLYTSPSPRDVEESRMPSSA